MLGVYVGVYVFCWTMLDYCCWTIVGLLLDYCMLIDFLFYFKRPGTRSYNIHVSIYTIYFEFQFRQFHFNFTIFLYKSTNVIHSDHK